MSHKRMSPEHSRLIAIGASMLLLAASNELAAASPPGPTPLNVRTSTAQGIPTFLSAADGGPIAVNGPPGMADTLAIRFLEDYGQTFGIDDPARQLLLSEVHSDTLGHTH